MEGLLESPSTVAGLVGLGLLLKGALGIVAPVRLGPLVRWIAIRRHPITPKRRQNDRFASSSFVGIGIGLCCSSLVLPATLVQVTTAVGLCSALVTWFFLRLEALTVTAARRQSTRS